MAKKKEMNNKNIDILYKKMMDKKSPSFNDDELPKAENCNVVEKKKYQKLSWWDRRKLKKHGDKAFLVRMLFSNGTCKEFVIVGKTETFTYRNRTYYLRYEDSWFNLTQNQFELCFFDDCPVPIERTIIKKGNKQFFAVTPENLKPLIKMEYVKALASSDDVIKRLRTLFIMSFIKLVLVALTLLVAAQSCSMLKKVAGG